MAEQPEALFVSDEGEIRLFPEYSDWRRDEPPPWESVDPEPAPVAPGAVVYRRLPPDDSPLQQGIRRLLAERDEARENVRFLMEMVEQTVREGTFSGGYSERLNGMWKRWCDLWRSLQDEEWFREPVG